MAVLFDDTFTGSSLNAAWTRRNIVTGDETWDSPGLTVANLGPGDFYLQNCPAGDFSVELEFTSKTTVGFMCGPAILDSSGTGVMVSPYHSPSGTLLLTSSTYGYGGSFQNAGGSNLAAGRVRVTKTAGLYTAAYSTDGGSTWSAESAAIGAPSFTFTPAKVGIGCIFGSGTIKLVELVVKDSTTPDATVNAPAATATTSGVAPTVSTTSTVTTPAAAATAAALAPTVSGAGDVMVDSPTATASAAASVPSLAWDADLSAATATATATALAPTVAASVTIAAPPAEATADAIAPAIDDGSGSQTVSPPPAIATATALAPSVLQVFPTSADTTNARQGRRRSARATVTITRPVAAPPASLVLATKVDKALAYPVPDMVDGRPV